MTVPPRVPPVCPATDRMPWSELPQAPCSRPVGPGWEVVLIPEETARRAVRHLDQLAAPLDPVGAVFALEHRWGFFVPEESDDPPWPENADYLACGAPVTLPPLHWTRQATGTGTGWVRRRNGRLLTAPLLLHPLVTAPRPAPRPCPSQPSAEGDRLCHAP